jgi:tetratricopeptide (TPR) repeat protein
MPDNDPQTGKAWPFVMSWTGRISALIGLGASIAGGVTWLVAHHRQKVEHQAQMALAQSEATLGQYPAELETYAGILKSDPLDTPALDGQLTAAMLWVENSHAPESAAAGPALDQIMAILAAGLVRAKGSRAADVQAHIGWAHWLNQHIAAREFGPDAEQNLRAALAADPHNVYASAMLGNWTLQNGGNIADAVQFFNTAVATGKARPFVRTLQLAGLVDRDVAGARNAVMQAANDMRRSGEPLDPDTRRRVVTFCCDLNLNNHVELAESLAAIPQDDAWSTYLWLDGSRSDHDAIRLQSLQHAFI